MYSGHAHPRSQDITLIKRDLRRDGSPFTVYDPHSYYTTKADPQTRIGMYWSVGNWNGIAVYTGDYCDAPITFSPVCAECGDPFCPGCCEED